MSQHKKLLRLSEVLERTGYSRSWIYRLISDNSFPQPIKIGSRSIAFVENEVEGWINQRIADSRGEVA
ncbi:dipicolinate synthase [Aeromonas piscicola]|nr:dipicolinate synthase [Aeromonas piscicola]